MMRNVRAQVGFTGHLRAAIVVIYCCDPLDLATGYTNSCFISRTSKSLSLLWPFYSSSCSGFNKAVILVCVCVCVYPLSFDGGGYIKPFTCQLQTHNLTFVKFASELLVSEG